MTVKNLDHTMKITKHEKPPLVLERSVNKKVKCDKTLKGTATFIGDIISPIDIEWDGGSSLVTKKEKQ